MGFSSYRYPVKEPDVLEEYGYEVPKEKGWSLLGSKFTNVLGGVLNVLRTGEYAIGGILSGKSPITGIKEKISPSTALGLRDEETKFWSERGIAGLAADILLDPFTYLSFGAGGALKLSTKGGQVLINKTGQKLLKTIVGKGASEAAARRTVAKLIQEGGEAVAKKYIGKSGLKFMGQVFIPSSYFRSAAKAVGATPVVGKLGNKVGGAFARAFKPFRDIDMLPAKIGGKGTYTDFLYKPFARETRDKIFKEIDEVKKVAASAYKEYGIEVGKTIGYKVETQKLTGTKLLDDIVKWMGKEQDSILKIEKATGKKIGEISGYLRHYLTKEGRDFIAKGNDFAGVLSKPLKASLAAAKPRKIAGTIQDINKIFTEKYGIKNFFEPDAFKAFALRKAEHVKFINTYKFVESAKARFGVRLDKATSTVTPEGIKLVEGAAPQLKGWLLPEPIIKHLDDTMKFLTNEETTKGFLRTYDKLLGVWKKNVTGLWPAFHSRNGIGGTFNSWEAYKHEFGLIVGKRELSMLEDSIDVQRILMGSDHIMKTKIGTKYAGKQFLDIAERFGVRGQPGQMDVARQVKGTIDEITAHNIKKIGLKASNAPRWAMEQVEDRLRLPLFLRGLKQGHSPAEAAKIVFKYHFDYLPETGLTVFEKNVMKRLIPFYVWTRNNVPLQLEMIMKQPGTFAGMEKVRQSLIGKEGREEMKWLPEWMKEMFIFPTGAIPGINWKDDAGRSLWTQLDLPLEDINKLPISSSGIREIASMLTPFLKYPIEAYMNRNFYFGGDIVNPKLPKEMQTTKVTETLKHLPNPIKKFLNFREVKYRDWRYPEEKKFITRYEMDAKKLHFINSFLGRYYSTLKGVFDEDIPLEWKISRYVGGVPVRPIDIPEEKEQREWEQENQAQEMLQWLQRHKLIPYKSEEQKATGLSKYLYQ